MDIIRRNFLRLLRAGAFEQDERIEPMTEWKWERLYQISHLHQVTPCIAEGIRRSKDDFFLQVKPDLWRRFEEDQTEMIEEFGRQELTNPLLNRTLQQIQEGAGIENPTFNLLEGLIAIARHILTTGISLRQFVALATYLYTTKDPLDFDLLKEWIRQLHMQRMVQLEGNLLVELFNFPAKRIPFTQAAANKTTRKLVNELFSTKGTSKHITYYPSEALTNFTSNLIQNLQNIEE